MHSLMGPGTRVLKPMDLRPGDVIAGPEQSRIIEVDKVKMILIWYRGVQVPVYWIKGIDSHSGKNLIKVQTVCLPRSSWYVFNRRQQS